LRSHRSAEAILGKLSKFQQNGQYLKISTKWTVSQDMYGVKISNLGHTLT